MFICKLLSGQDPLSPGRGCSDKGKGQKKKTKQQHSWERLRDVRKLPVMWAGFISRPEPGSGAEAEAPLG